MTCKFPNNTKNISNRQTKFRKKKMNSVEVQALSLYSNEGRWRKQNTPPRWTKEITVGAISDQQMWGGTGHIVVCTMGEGGGGVHVEKEKLREHTLK